MALVQTQDLAKSRCQTLLRSAWLMLWTTERLCDEKGPTAISRAGIRTLPGAISCGPDDFLNYLFDQRWLESALQHNKVCFHLFLFEFASMPKKSAHSDRYRSYPSTWRPWFTECRFLKHRSWQLQRFARKFKAVAPIALVSEWQVHRKFCSVSAV